MTQIIIKFKTYLHVLTFHFSVTIISMEIFKLYLKVIYLQPSSNNSRKSFILQNFSVLDEEKKVSLEYDNNNNK